MSQQNPIGLELGVYREQAIDYSAMMSNAQDKHGNDRNSHKNYESLKPYYYNDVNFVPLIKSISHRKSSSQIQTQKTLSKREQLLSQYSGHEKDQHSLLQQLQQIKTDGNNRAVKIDAKSNINKRLQNNNSNSPFTNRWNMLIAQNMVRNKVKNSKIKKALEDINKVVLPKIIDAGGGTANSQIQSQIDLTVIPNKSPIQNKSQNDFRSLRNSVDATTGMSDPNEQKQVQNILKQNKLYQDDYLPYRNKVRLMDKEKAFVGSSMKIRSEKTISPRHTSKLPFNREKFLNDVLQAKNYIVSTKIKLKKQYVSSSIDGDFQDDNNNYSNSYIQQFDITTTKYKIPDQNTTDLKQLNINTECEKRDEGTDTYHLSSDNYRAHYLHQNQRRFPPKIVIQSKRLKSIMIDQPIKEQLKQQQKQNQEMQMLYLTNQGIKQEDTFGYIKDQQRHYFNSFKKDKLNYRSFTDKKPLENSFYDSGYNTGWRQHIEEGIQVDINLIQS
ncbi:UNKNOWN [Stylonychia lemnae]|uniref:Uncharacterized protein n=1 Tax=Stylonychia lemnae TaxID=5949 RepID=A0A078A253_STYLE|nr:UNKNOWN [Stylonychia lemnae]|eukprot:CDW76311.1 UNKNOWN [Stylonychia lemnae]